MMRYIIIDPEEGVFLGTHGTPIPSQGVRIVPLFSKQNIFEITKAASFPSKTAANTYLNKYLKTSCPKAFIAPIESKDSKTEFVDVIDIVKSGYGEYAEGMVEAIPMDNRSIH
jgi:hypothetical protein